jgi:hypothetical protein
LIRHPLVREATLCAAAAAGLAALLAWLGPPGSDLAAHAYQRSVFLEHGFALWNNFWYAGRYSFVTYSLLYYPLAAVLGIKLLAVATIAAASLAFAVVLWREWGPAARWSSRTFAIVWAGIVLSAAFPFALGMALALLAIWALQAGARWRFALLAALTVTASPVAFLLLVVVVVGIALARREGVRRWSVPAAALGSVGVAEILVWRAFPGGGRYPFSLVEATVSVAFCVVGFALTWRVEALGVLRWVFVVYLAACVTAYVVPSEIGENVARIRYAAVPLAVLIFSVRGWRPRRVAFVIVALAVCWNLSPLAASFERGRVDPAASAAYWAPAVAFLRTHLTPSYRVEAVDTAGHWPAVYLARAGIPIARGWFRQDDFPQNELLYSPLGSRRYLAWLRGLGVRYVVLTTAPPDYSARAEAELVRSGRAGLRPVLRTAALTVYAVPRPRALVTGPGRPSVRALSGGRIVVAAPVAGWFRLAVRWSPYWRTSTGCISRGLDGMIRFRTVRPGTVRFTFDVDAGRAIAAVAGRRLQNCAGA